METGAYSLGKSSTHTPVIQRPQMSGFGLFPRTKLVRMLFKNEEKKDVTNFCRLLRRVTSGVTDFFRNKKGIFQANASPMLN